VNERTPLYALAAEFSTAGDLRDAADALAGAGYSALDAYSPFPIEGLGYRLSARRSRLPAAMFFAAAIAGVGTYAMEWYAAVIDYPLNVGGRPNASWPLFLPPAIEMTVLGAVLMGVAAFLWRCGLPRFHHPMFELQAFERASQDRFFLVVRCEGKDFDERRCEECLGQRSPIAIHRVRQ
jgi:hypothetical protein